MRKLAWAALGFAAAAALAEYILPVKGLPYVAAALALLSLCSLLLRRRALRKRAFLCLLAAAAGLTAWQARYSLRLAPAEERVQAMAGQDVPVFARVTDYPERHPNYQRVEVRFLGDDGPQERALLYLYEGTLPDLEPGDLIQAQVRLTSAVTRRGQRSHIYTSQGIDLLGYIQPQTLSLSGRWEHAWLYFPQQLSQGVKDCCERLFPADAAPFLKALLTGDSTDLEQDAAGYTAMRVSGVLHIVAVSGMHLFVLVAFAQLLLGKSRRTGLICLPVIWLFALMAGFRAGVVRAAVMQSLYLLAPAAGRESDGVTSLGAALLLLLGMNPMAVGGVGLQLSFACMAGLVWILPAVMGWMEKHLPMHRFLVAAAAGNVACSIAATAFSLPLAAYYFGLVPLLSPVANLLTLFVVEVVFGAGYVVCALGAAIPALGQALGWVLAWPVRWCMAVYGTVASVPFAGLYTAAPRTVLWLAGVYALFLLWYLLRRKRKRLPLDVPVCLSVMGLCLVLLAGKGSIPAGEGRLTVLDVDQGQCVVLADRDTAVVMDCGGAGRDSAGDLAANCLLSQGHTRADALILTHLHRDHANGVEVLLYRMKVDRLILPAGADDTDGLLPGILAAAQSRGTQVISLSEERMAQLGGMTLDLLLPQGGDVNERGIVIRAGLAGRSVLVMGDAGTDAELSLLQSGSVPDVDVLVAGHHGSKTASGALFLAAAAPETAVISVGYNNYGQPSEETLSRLDRFHVRVLRTDTEGTVTIPLRSEEIANGGQG